MPTQTTRPLSIHTNGIDLDCSANRRIFYRMMQEPSADLFSDIDVDVDTEPRTDTLAPGAVVLRGFAGANDEVLVAALHDVLEQASVRRMVTPGGFAMSVAMTNCGDLGWVTDRRGYRYQSFDPESGRPWPTMPDAFLSLAIAAAVQAGFDGFAPNACLINRYEPGARLSLHQDKGEGTLYAPVVSVSLGVPAIFLFGGDHRSDKQQRVALEHGDVVVFGGPSRLRFHGITPLAENYHPLLGPHRFNLTFRKVV